MSVKPLTRKQAAFVKHIVDNPKSSYTDAARIAYNLKSGDDKTNSTARTIAAQNLAKPSIVSALSNHVELIEAATIKTVQDWKDEESPRKREIAMQNAQWIHDKVFGRSKQQVEMTSTSVSINIDLTGQAEPTNDLT